MWKLSVYNNIQFVDDSMILADNVNDLQTLLYQLNKEIQRLRLKINIVKN